MSLDFRSTTPEDSTTLDRLFQLFLHDTAALCGKDIGDDGYYHGIDDLKDYTTKSNYKTFFIEVDKKLAGFVVIRFDSDINYLRHFFIIRKYRRFKVGTQVAFKVFDMKGNWRVSTMDSNIPAIKFWENTIKRYTNNNYKKIRRTDNKGPQFEIYK